MNIAEVEASSTVKISRGRPSSFHEHMFQTWAGTLKSLIMNPAESVASVAPDAAPDTADQWQRLPILYYFYIYGIQIILV